MPRVGFESTIPVFEQEETFHDFDHMAAVVYYSSSKRYNLIGKKSTS
jgi:hypothetical protein